MSDPIIEYLNTLSLTHDYLNLSNLDIPILHTTIANYTESPKISKDVLNQINKIIQDNNIKNDKKLNYENYENFHLKPKSKLSNEYKIRLYILQLRLEIIMSEFRLATGTISRLKDLFAQLNVQEEIGPLCLIITLRSELLEVESFIESHYNNKDLTESIQFNDNIKNNENKDKNKKGSNSPFDNLAIVKNIVISYIDKSTDIVINSINRTAALSVTSSGIESIRNQNDLYSIQKRKSSLDKNIAEIASIIKIDENNKIIINPELVANESINALLELLKMRPLDTENYIELSKIYLSNGKIKEALYCISETLLTGCSKAWNIWSLRGEICMIQSNCLLNENKKGKKIVRSWLYASIASFSYAIELCSDYVRAWCGLYVSLKKLINLNLNDTDLIYTKMNLITSKKINDLLIDKSIPITERENINWILENYK